MKGQPLKLEQVASLCGVSLKRVRRWIDKRELKVVLAPEGGERVESAEMVDFFLKHNIPLPDAIVPFKAKKILFLCANDSEARTFMKFLITFLRQLKKTGNAFIADHITFGPDAKMKVMVFKPDVIILDMTGNDGDAVAMSIIIKGMEEFSATKLVGITGAETFDCDKALARVCGIDEVASDCTEIAPLTRKLLD